MQDSRQDSPSAVRHVVTAVLVTHDGDRWLPDTLKALLTQTRPVQRLVVVDTGSTDRGPAVLAEVVGAGNVLTLPADTGYGAALTAAVAHPAASLPVANAAPDHVEWLWLLHDDSTPNQHTLDRLLRAADTDPGGIGVLGPKIRDWDDKRLLLEIGTTVDGFGRRQTGVERGELDQGQHDGRGPQDVLAVSSAGMLVRRDLWQRVGGFDERLALFRDDLDLGWRAHAEGQRVVAVSEAILYHAEATARGLRPTPAPGVTASRLDRRNALFVLLVNMPVRPMLRTAARNLFGSLVKSARLALTKRPQAARDELGALRDVFLHPIALYRGRARRKRGRGHVYRHVRRFFATQVMLRRFGEWLGAVIAGDLVLRRRSTAPEEGLLRRALRNPGVLLVAGLTLVSLVAGRSLVLAGPRIGGGALLPGLGSLWDSYLAGWHPVGLGSNTGAAPYLGVLALLSVPLLGQTWLLLTILLVGAVPLAGLTGYLAAHTLIPDDYLSGGRRARARGPLPAWALRVWLATGYALLPAALGAVAAGRIGTIVVLIILPPLGLLTGRILRPKRGGRVDPRLAARRAAWGVGVLLTVGTAFAPVLWLIALLVGAIVWTAFWTARRGGGGDLLVALGLPLVLLGPWGFGLLLHPSRFLLQAGLTLPALSDSPLPSRDLLFLRPGGPGAPTWWLTAGLVVIALAALGLRAHRQRALAGWLVALFGLLAAVLVSALSAGGARGWPGVPLLAAGAGLLLAASSSIQWAAERFIGRDLVMRVSGGLLLLVAAASPVLAAGYWVWHGVPGPVGQVSGLLGQSLSGETESGSHQFRTLVLTQRPGGPVRYTVVRGRQPSTGDETLPTTGAAGHQMDTVVAALAAAHGDAFALARMGVQYLYVPDPADDPLVAALDATPNVSRLGRNDAFALWRVVPEAGRLLLTDGATTAALAAGETDAAVTIPAGNEGRTLLLAEPDDGGWHATLDGAALHPAKADGWALEYRIPASGGRFELSHGMLSHHIWVCFQGVLLLIAVLAALPSPEDERLRRRAGVRRADELRDRAARASAAAGALARTRAKEGVRTLRDARTARRRPELPGPRTDEPEPGTEPVPRAEDEPQDEDVRS